LLRLKEISWFPLIFIVTYHLALFIALPLYFFQGLPSVGLITASLILFFLIGIGVTAGYHRFYSHRAYRLNTIVEGVLLFFGTLATEMSVLYWSSDHRSHHAHVDTEKDPYSIKKGFMHAHILWIFEKRQSRNTEIVSDLLQNKLVVFQHKYYNLLWFFSNLLVVSGIGFFFKDFFGAVVFSFLLRMFVVHHFTWFINSLAHTAGSQTYSKEHSAVDNYLVSLVSFGEGYHNYHHTFASDYRNGVKWYHFDPTKWLVWLLSKCGLAGSVVRFNVYTIKRRLISEDKRLALDKVRNTMYVQKQLLQQRIHLLADALSSRLTDLQRIKSEYVLRKKTVTRREVLMKLKSDIKAQKKLLKAEWVAWCGFLKEIRRLQPQLQ